MNKFFKKLQKLERKHLHELAIMCGSVALLLMIAVFVRVGVPATAYAFYINVVPSYTPVATGGYTTISWVAYDADYCYINYHPTATSGHLSGETCRPEITWGWGPFKWTIPASCSLYVQGRSGRSYAVNGSATAGPMNGATTYNISCINSGRWNSGNGSASITVYPTAPVYTRSTVSISASPIRVTIGDTGSTIYWSTSRGNNYYGTYLYKGGVGAGYQPSSGSTPTGSLTKPATQYEVVAYDSQLGWGTPAYVTVTAAAPVVCSNGLNGNAYPSCTCPSGQVPSGKTCITPPPDMCTDISGTQTSLPSGCVGPTPAPSGKCIPTNGSYNGFQCTCPQYATLQNGKCVLPTYCPNGLTYATYGPTCSCPSGQAQPSGSHSCVVKGSISSFTAAPVRVQKGRTTTVTWATQNMSTCAVTELTTSGTQTLSSAKNGTLTPSIISKAIFTLTCTDAADLTTSASQTVDVVPVFNEE